MQTGIKKTAIDEEKKIFNEKQLHIWYEIVQALDKKSVFFSDQQFCSELPTLKKDRNETVIVYLTRAEKIQYNLEQMNE